MPLQPTDLIAVHRPGVGTFSMPASTLVAMYVQKAYDGPAGEQIISRSLVSENSPKGQWIFGTYDKNGSGLFKDANGQVVLALRDQNGDISFQVEGDSGRITSPGEVISVGSGQWAFLAIGEPPGARGARAQAESSAGIYAEPDGSFSLSMTDSAGRETFRVDSQIGTIRSDRLAGAGPSFVGATDNGLLERWNPASSEAFAGLLRLATGLETAQGVADNLAVSPLHLKERLDGIIAGTGSFLPLTGGTLTGPVISNGPGGQWAFATAGDNPSGFYRLPDGEIQLALRNNDGSKISFRVDGNSGNTLIEGDAIANGVFISQGTDQWAFLARNPGGLSAGGIFANADGSFNLLLTDGAGKTTFQVDSAAGNMLADGYLRSLKLSEPGPSFVGVDDNGTLLRWNPTSSETFAGLLRLATDGEVAAGTPGLAVQPQQLRGALGAYLPLTGGTVTGELRSQQTGAGWAFGTATPNASGFYRLPTGEILLALRSLAEDITFDVSGESGQMRSGHLAGVGPSFVGADDDGRVLRWNPTSSEAFAGLLRLATDGEVAAGTPGLAVQPQQLRGALGAYLPLTGGTVTGEVISNGPDGRWAFATHGDNASGLYRDGNGNILLALRNKAKEITAQIEGVNGSLSANQVSSAGQVRSGASNDWALLAQRADNLSIAGIYANPDGSYALALGNSAGVGTFSVNSETGTVTALGPAAFDGLLSTNGIISTDLKGDSIRPLSVNAQGQLVVFQENIPDVIEVYVSPGGQDPARMDALLNRPPTTPETAVRSLYHASRYVSMVYKGANQKAVIKLAPGFYKPFSIWPCNVEFQSWNADFTVRTYPSDTITDTGHNHYDGRHYNDPTQLPQFMTWQMSVVPRRFVNWYNNAEPGSGAKNNQMYPACYGQTMEFQAGVDFVGGFCFLGLGDILARIADGSIPLDWFWNCDEEGYTPAKAPVPVAGRNNVHEFLTSIRQKVYGTGAFFYEAITTAPVFKITGTGKQRAWIRNCALGPALPARKEALGGLRDPYIAANRPGCLRVSNVFLYGSTQIYNEADSTGTVFLQQVQHSGKAPYGDSWLPATATNPPQYSYIWCQFHHTFISTTLDAPSSYLHIEGLGANYYSEDPANSSLRNYFRCKASPAILPNSIWLCKPYKPGGLPEPAFNVANDTNPEPEENGPYMDAFIHGRTGCRIDQAWDSLFESDGLTIKPLGQGFWGAFGANRYNKVLTRLILCGDASGRMDVQEAEGFFTLEFGPDYPFADVSEAGQPPGFVARTIGCRAGGNTVTEGRIPWKGNVNALGQTSNGLAHGLTTDPDGGKASVALRAGVRFFMSGASSTYGTSIRQPVSM